MEKKTLEQFQIEVNIDLFYISSEFNEIRKIVQESKYFHSVFEFVDFELAHLDAFLSRVAKNKMRLFEETGKEY